MNHRSVLVGLLGGVLLTGTVLPTTLGWLPTLAMEGWPPIPLVLAVFCLGLAPLVLLAAGGAAAWLTPRHPIAAGLQASAVAVTVALIAAVLPGLLVASAVPDLQWIDAGSNYNQLHSSHELSLPAHLWLSPVGALVILGIGFAAGLVSAPLTAWLDRPRPIRPDALPLAGAIACTIAGLAGGLALADIGDRLHRVHDFGVVVAEALVLGPVVAAAGLAALCMAVATRDALVIRAAGRRGEAALRTLVITMLPVVTAAASAGVGRLAAGVVLAFGMAVGVTLGLAWQSALPVGLDRRPRTLTELLGRSAVAGLGLAVMVFVPVVTPILGVRMSTTGGGTATAAEPVAAFVQAAFFAHWALAFAIAALGALAFLTVAMVAWAFRRVLATYDDRASASPVLGWGDPDIRLGRRGLPAPPLDGDETDWGGEVAATARAPATARP